jgi:hypothetical protein
MKMSHRPDSIISGGQTGVDRAGLDAGLELGIDIGGFCPKGRKSEDGPIPDEYPLVEMDTDSYDQRTRHNVAQADATVIMSGSSLGPGSRLTVTACKQVHQPYLRLNLEDDPGVNATLLRDWLNEHKPLTLNVAGSRESKMPGAYEKAKAILLLALGGSE